jgi:hypothetical protein
MMDLMEKIYCKKDQQLELKMQPEKFKVANKIKVKLNSKCNDNSLFKSFWDFQAVIS